MAEDNGVKTMIEPAKEVLAVAKPAPAVPKLFMFVPKDLTELMKYADMVAGSPFVPKGYAGNGGACLVAMQFGAELGLPPLQALQNIAVINGKPGIYGDLGKALLYSKGFKIEERDSKETQAKGEAWCKVTRPTGEVTERTFSLDMAKTAKLWGKEGPWSTYPYRQMGWRAFWFAARDAGADVLKGIGGIEELRDYDAETTAVAVLENAPKELPAFNREQAVKDAAPKSEEPTPANPVVDVTPKKAEPPSNGLTPEQRKNVVALMAKFNVDGPELREYLRKRWGITDEKRPTAFVTQGDDYAELCNWIEAPQDDLPLGV